jgi:HEPN domain-containing protein
MPLNDQTPEYWFTLAKHDMDSANLLLRENGYPDIIVYHFHQGVEKLLKGIILAKKVSFPFIHDLERLFKILEDMDSRFASLLEPIILLQSFYKNLRYPQSAFLSQSELVASQTAFTTILSELKTLAPETTKFLD